MQTPEGWQITTLSELADFINGRAFKPSEWAEAGLPIIRIAQISNPKTEPNYYDGADVDPKHLIVDGDLLFSWSATLAVMRWAQGPAVLNQHIFKVVEREGVSRDFLHHLIGASIPSLAEHSHGSTMKHIRKGVLKEFRVALPPLPEQRKIATILSSVADTIEKTEAVIEQLQIVRKALMQALLTRGLPGRHSRFKKTELGQVPQEWAVVPLHTLAAPGRSSFVNGPFGSNLLKADLMSTGVPVIYIRDIRGGEYSRVSEACVTTAKAAELKICSVRPGDLLIAKVGDPPGVTAIYPEHEPVGIVTQDVIRLRPNQSKVDVVFLQAYLNSPLGSQIVDGISIEGTRRRVALGTFKKIPAPLPGLPEQCAIGRIMKEITNRLNAERKTLSALSAMKASLMPLLLTGKLHVIPDETSL